MHAFVILDVWYMTCHLCRGRWYDTASARLDMSVISRLDLQVSGTCHRVPASRVSSLRRDHAVPLRAADRREIVVNSGL